MKKKKFDLYKTLRIVFLMLAILTMAMSIVGKGHAEGYSVSSFSSYILDCYDYSSIYHTEYTDSLINDIISSSVGFYEFYNDNNEHLFVFSNNEYAQGYVYNQRFNPTSFTEPFNMNISKQLDYYYGSNSFTMFYTDTSHRINLNNLIVYSVFTSNNALIIYKGIVGSNTYWQDLSASPGYYLSFENRRYKFNLNDGTWTTGNDLSSFTAKYYHSVGNNVIGSYYNDSFRAYTSPEIFTDDMLNLTFDDNFSIYKTYGVGGIDDPILNIEYLDNIFSQGYTYTDSTTYALTFDVDGVESTVSISSTVYPDEFVAHSGLRTSFDLIYRMLSNKILNFSSASTVTLKQVSMTATAYPTSNQQGTPETVTKSTLCNLVLKGSQMGEYDSIDSEQASNVEVNYSNIINTESYTNTNIVTVDSLVSDEGIEYPLEMTPSWANTGVLLMTYKDYSTNGLLYPSGWSDLQNYDRYSIWADKNNNYHLYYQPYGYVNHIEVDPDITITWPPSIATSSYNDYSMFVGVDNEGSIKYDYMDRWYDVYMLIYYVGNGRFEYKMIYTDRYFEKLKLNSLNSIQSAVQSGAYYTKETYLFLFDALNTLNNNMMGHFGVSESNESVANNLLSSINANLSGLDSYFYGIIASINTTHGKLDTIITKLDNLSLGGGSSITPSQLTTVLTDLFVPHYQYIEPSFNEYKSQLGILALPFDYSSEVYDTIKSNYSDKMELTIPSASFKADSSTEYTVMQGFDWEFEPETLFSENENIHSIFTSIQYLNAFLAILGASWFTYCHIFRRNETNDN